jgi:hypothetical protein
MSTEADAVKIMRAKIKQAGLSFLDKVSLRTFAQLCIMGDENIHESLDYKIDATRLREVIEGDDDGFLPGPFISCKTDSDQNKRSILEVQSALFYPNLEVRRAALNLLEGWEKCAIFTLKTTHCINQQKAWLLSDQDDFWLSAACIISDALHEDFCFSLAGVRQLLTHRQIAQNNLNSYAPRIMRPSIDSFDSAFEQISFYEDCQQQLTQIINDLVAEASSLQALCERYLSKLGHMPLDEQYSLGAAIEKWSTGKSEIDFWGELWSWADSEGTPVSRCHVIFFFIMRSQFIPETQWPVFWDEVALAVSDLFGELETEKNNGPWRLWQQLAKLYYLSIEVQVPNTIGANVAGSAWWLASRTAKVLSAKANTVPVYIEKWVEPEISFAGRLWIYAMSPAQKRDLFSYLTYLGISSWGFALISEMGRHADALQLDQISKESRISIEKALIFGTAFAAPSAKRSELSVLALDEKSFLCFVQQFIKHATSQETGLQEMADFSSKYESTEFYMQRLRNLPDTQGEDLGLLAWVTRKHCCLEEPKTREAIWSIISSGDWFKKLSQKLECKHLGVYGEAFLGLISYESGEWYYQLPHLFANACESTEDNEKRAELFRLVIGASIGSNSVSALQRLLKKSQYRREYQQQAGDMRQQILNSWEMLPGWVQAKMRALLVVLPNNHGIATNAGN